jgi:hypothetical protein
MTEVGYASLGIAPSFDGFERNLQRGAAGPMASVGGTSGRTFGDAAGKSAGSRFGSAFKTAAKAGLVGLGVLGVGAAKLAGDAVSAASDLEESTNKVAQVFGRGANDVFRFSSKAADALGQTNQQARDAAATFGIFGNVAGLTDKKNAKFAKRMTTLASDLASFSNTEPEQAVEALGAALRGESEPIRAYGVLLDEATLKAEAMRIGLLKPVKDQAKIKTYQVAILDGQKNYNDAVKEFGPKSLEALKAEAALGTARDRLQKATEGTIPALTQQQKVLAAQSSIMQQTSTQQGDFARTSDGLANQQRRLTARWEDAKAELGVGLLPIMTKAADFLLDTGIPAFERFSDWFNDTGLPAIKGFAGYFEDNLLPPIKRFADEAKPILADVFDGAKKVLDDVVPMVEGLVDKFEGLPDGVKKGLLIGAGALTLNKLIGRGGGGGGGEGGLLSGGRGTLAGAIRGSVVDKSGELIAGRLLRRFERPLPVFVVNPGGVGGGGGGIGGKAGKFGLLAGATLPTALIATAVVGILATPQVGKWLANKEAEVLGIPKRKERGPDSAAAGTDTHRDIIADRFRTGGAAVDAYNDQLSNTRDRIIEMTNGAGDFIGKAETLRDHLTVVTNGATVPFKSPGLNDVLTKSRDYKGILEGIPQTVRTNFVASYTSNNTVEDIGGNGARTPRATTNDNRIIINGDIRPHNFAESERDLRRKQRARSGGGR